MTTTTTATRSARTAVEAPAPSGPAWDWYLAHQPQVDQARIAGRWAAAVALFEARAAGAPDASGARTVKSSRADSPDRQAGEPVAYMVWIVATSPRRIYACACPDYQNRGSQTHPCKHILAVWYAVHAACQLRQAQAEAVEAAQVITAATATPAERIAAAVAGLTATQPEAFAALLDAIAARDGKTARTATARLAGWPSRNRRRETGAASTAVITQLAA